MLHPKSPAGKICLLFSRFAIMPLLHTVIHAFALKELFTTHPAFIKKTARLYKYAIA